MHGGLVVSTWVRRWSHLVAPGSTVLDVACGGGRHLRWFVQRGCRVTGVDRDAAALAALAETGAELIAADIEAGPWPFTGRGFDAVVVTNYLWRERMPDLLASLAPNGVLLYETFAAGNETVGKPSNPQFLLRPGELTSVELVADYDWPRDPDEQWPQWYATYMVAERTGQELPE